MSWLYIYPKGFRDYLLYIKHKYNNPVLYVTENGELLDLINCFQSFINFVLFDYLFYYSANLAFLFLDYVAP